MTTAPMDSSLAAFLFALVYGPNAWMSIRMWAGLEDRLDVALERGRKALVSHQVPLSRLFATDCNHHDQHLIGRVRNYFSGEATIILTRPLHLILSLPLVLWGIAAIQGSDLWQKGQIPITDFRVIFGGACLWLIVSTGVFFLQFWGFRKLAGAVPNISRD
jgi:hypothetical protein